MEEERGQKPTILVVFGVTGDLSRRYLLPALIEIFKADQLPDDFVVLGISRRNIGSKDVFNERTHLLQRLTEFLQMDMANEADYQKLKKVLRRYSAKFKTRPQIIFYFAVPPAAVLPVVRQLGQAKLNTSNVKLLLEKPFGVDYESAQELIKQTENFFSEDQIYRIDHYLAKEVAQNISVFLGSNVLFRDVFNSRFIEFIEIVAAEKIGIEGRSNFYEQTGALRDIVQSHLLQLAALTLMEPYPDVFDFSELPARRLAALKQLKAPPADKLDKQVFRAQYRGYQAEIGNPGSSVETFVAMQLMSEDPRWSGVPIFLATGKKLDEKLTEIRVSFKGTRESAANRLTIRIQPREGIELELWVKQPGYERRLEKKSLSFAFGQDVDRLPDAYEQVIVDAIAGSHSLFASSQEVLASWTILQPIIERWSLSSDNLKFYKPGSSIEKILKSRVYNR